MNSSPHADLEVQLLESSDPVERLRLTTELIGMILNAEPERADALIKEGEKIAARLRKQGLGRQECAKLKQLSARRHFIVNEYDLAQRDYDQALQLYERLGDKHGIAHTLYLVGNMAASRSEYQQAESLFERAKNIYEEIDSLAGLASCQSSIGALYSRTGRAREAFERFSAAHTLGKQIGDRNEQAVALQGMGLEQNHLGNFDEALDLLLRSLALHESLGESHNSSYLLSNIGNVYATIPDYARAIEYYERSLAIAEGRGDSNSLANISVNLGSMYLQLQDFDRAIATLDRGVALAEKIENPICYAAGLEALSDANLQQGNVRLARERIEQAIEVKRRVRHQSGMPGALIIQGKILAATGEYAEGIRAIEQGIAIATELGAKPEIRNAYQLLANVYRDAGDHANAFAAFERFHIVSDELLRLEGSKRIENIKLKAERDRTEARTLQLERDKERMERELDLKTKHLTTLAMTIEQHSNFIGSIGSALRDVSKDIPERKRKGIDELRKQLKQNQSATEEWKLFEQQLENLDQDFIALLAGKFPMLTPQEMKLCALLKVGLGSKEIAKVLSVTLRSVETYRLHIRRKIRLPASINLTTFIAGLR